MKNLDTFKIIKLIGEAPKELLTSTETHILTKITIFANKQGKGARPSIQRLVKETKCSDKTVRRTLKSLVSKGFLIVAFKPKNGSWRPVCYDINVLLLEEKAVVYKDDYLEYGEDLEENTVYTSGVTMTESTVTVSQSAVIEDVKHGHDDRQSTNDLPISTNDLPNNNVELASNSTTAAEQPSVILEDKPTKPTPEPEPEEHPEPLAAEPVSQPKAKRNENYWKPVVLSIFAYWQIVLNHPKAKLDANRGACIVKALKLGFSEDDLKKAIYGLSKTPHNIGVNDRGEVYDGLHIVFRSAEQIERFMRNADNPPKATLKLAHEQKKQNFMERHTENMRMMDDITMKYFPEFGKYFGTEKRVAMRNAPSNKFVQEMIAHGI